MKKSTIFLFLCLVTIITSPISAHDELEKHSNQSATASSPLTTIARHDELLKQAVELGRMLTDPHTIDLDAWTTFLSREIALGTVIGSAGFYTTSTYTPQKKLLLSVATSVAISLGLTVSFSYAMVKYNKWRIKQIASHFKQLIGQSTNQEELLIIHELMCRYLTELSTYYSTTSAVKECATLLRDIVTMLHRRISELKKLENQPQRLVE